MGDINTNEEIYGIDPLYIKLHPTLRYDENFFEKIVKKYPHLVVYAARKLKNNQSFLERMARSNGYVLQYLQEHYILTTVPADNLRGWEFKKNYAVDNPRIVFDAVKENGLVLTYASERNKNNKTIAWIAIGQNWRAFRFCSKKIQQDNETSNFALLRAYSSKEFLREGFNNDNDSIIHITPEQLFNNKQLINFFTDENQMKMLKKEIKNTASSILQSLDSKKENHRKYAIEIFESTKNSMKKIKELQEKYKKDNTITQINEQIQEL